MVGTLGPKVYPLSNREADFRAQNILVVGKDGGLQFAPFVRHGPTVPTEILAEIFFHCLPDDHDYVVPDVATAPLILCGICRRWREVAISTPRLWSSLRIDFDLMLKRRVYETGFYKMWLSRAGGTPLSLFLQNEGDVSVGLVDSLLKGIVGLSRQWRQIEVDMGDALANFISPAENKFPLLERLDIMAVFTDLSISFCEAPKLREVTICRHSQGLKLPWHQLTKISCCEVPVSSCLQILRDSSNLLDGNFEVRGDPSALPVPILQHGCLRRLELSASYDDAGTPGNIMAFLHCLETPGLQDLTLEFSDGTSTFPADISLFLSFISGSSCQLRTLNLAYMQASSHTLVECLKATPSLVYLQVTLTPTPLLVDADELLTHFSKAVDFLPKLESFHAAYPFTTFPFEYDILCMPTVSVVVQMLCARWAGVGTARLQSFRLEHFHYDLEFDETIKSHPEYQRLQAEGMDLYLGQ
ncbi:hypothetical protein DFH06DRAFT_1029448 [Mycena polygramma]|nr:hypothetical protein DFH06DRAFT_1029448 [Mycena polygramma]